MMNGMYLDKFPAQIFPEKIKRRYPLFCQMGDSQTVGNSGIAKGGFDGALPVTYETNPHEHTTWDLQLLPVLLGELAEASGA